MNNSQVTFVEGVVAENLPNALFRIKTDDERMILCRLSGKMRTNYIRLLPGDRVRCETPIQDPNRGRIIFKFR
ncbi:translation initiation factor IF-1 [Candidatus Amesbacteria bacterium RIFCSPHIGHO2_01_FULL_48_32]|uniref:Translation initiation factor IF-1 n=1 Tax=Candidatus Amesbacteria bacterium RIFCSPLOWO2_01_FULL_48_25 TaxID=1797259 RepID=A0A1F4ZA93_9BACT|nr:MAG: translation initiation factor IF-1 [Candidatus Amesbacteria bacterium RIFCSPHIGHO2_01_FULL_48_32]OGD03329.1 MAG: translation initiation factor IF-1 [Candidatus Amesbacteria bacterium RIFCSPLOWO2_01_FULL_48_25]HJZ05278.1 translation initiation factor IF-1 [Patescibacteria group bacterium]